jgi:hypothetical protein
MRVKNEEPIENDELAGVVEYDLHGDYLSEAAVTMGSIFLPEDVAPSLLGPQGDPIFFGAKKINKKEASSSSASSRAQVTKITRTNPACYTSRRLGRSISMHQRMSVPSRKRYFICDNNDSDDEDEYGGVGYNDSDDEADGVGVGYNGDGVDKTIISAKRDSPINLIINMASKLFSWESSNFIYKRLT